MDTKKKSHIGSELKMIKGYLFRGRLPDHSPLLEQRNPAAGRERDRELYIGICSIRDHIQVGG